MSEHMTPDEAIEYALKNNIQGISIGLAKSLRGERNALNVQREIDLAKMKKAMLDVIDRISPMVEKIKSLEKELSESRAQLKESQDMESFYRCEWQHAKEQLAEAVALAYEDAAKEAMCFDAALGNRTCEPCQNCILAARFLGKASAARSLYNAIRPQSGRTDEKRENK